MFLPSTYTAPVHAGNGSSDEEDESDDDDTSSSGGNDNMVDGHGTSHPSMKQS